MILEPIKYLYNYCWLNKFNPNRFDYYNKALQCVVYTSFLLTTIVFLIISSTQMFLNASTLSEYVKILLVTAFFTYGGFTVILTCWLLLYMLITLMKESDLVHSINYWFKELKELNAYTKNIKNKKK